MMRLTLLFGAMAVLALLPASAIADWEENFDSYENGSSMHGQGGWKGWDNDPAWTAYVTDVQARSDPHSVDIVDAADLVHEYSGYTSGQWTYTAWQYIPTTDPNDPNHFEGTTYFILLSDYEDGMGQDNEWAVQISFDSYDQVVTSEYDSDPNDPNGGPVTLPLITGQWVELRTEIDLDADWFEFYYDGELLVAKAWTATPNNNGNGVLVIDAVDLYANFATSAYYDDMSLKPGGCPGDIDGDGDTDHSDLGELLAAWCTQQGDPNWNPDADLDGDGHVGHGDLGILLADWGCGT